MYYALLTLYIIVSVIFILRMMIILPLGRLIVIVFAVKGCVDVLLKIFN